MCAVCAVGCNRGGGGEAPAAKETSAASEATATPEAAADDADATTPPEPPAEPEVGANTDDAVAPLPPPSETRAVQIEVELLGSTRVRVGAELPVAFVPWEGFRDGTFHLPPAALGLGEYEQTASISLDATCNGSCTPFDLPGNIRAQYEGARRGARQPNFNTGNPELDAVRAQVEELVGELSDTHAVLVQRITYDAETAAKHPLSPSTTLTCIAMVPGEDWFVTMSGRVEPALEADWLEAMTTACRSLRSLGRVPTEAELREPIVVRAEGGLDFSALPEGSWTPERSDEESGKPYAVLLTAPLRFNDVPIAPSGSVYLYHERTPPTLSQFVLAADHPFPVAPELGIEGNQASCQRDQTVYLRPEGTLSECRLAADLRVGEVTLAAFGETRFGTTAVTGGVLAEDTRIDSIPCARHHHVHFHEQHGGKLEDCTLSEARTFGKGKHEVRLEAGTQVELDPQGRLTGARLEAPHTLQGQSVEKRGYAEFDPETGALTRLQAYD